jgi:hypothetical protein
MHIVITLTRSSAFCLACIKKKQPWYWIVKGFINDHPNLMQTGVGNNSTSYDISVLQHSSGSDGNAGEDDDTSDGALALGDDVDGQREPTVDDYDWVNWRPTPEKDAESDDIVRSGARAGDKQRKGSEAGKKVTKKIKVDKKKPMAPHTSKATPAASSSTQKKSRTGLKKFSDVAVKEEEMTQKIIDFKKTKAQGFANKEIAKVKLKADVEMNRNKLKANFTARKLELEFEAKCFQVELEYKYKFVQLQAQAPSTGTASNSLPSQSIPNHLDAVWASHHPDQQNNFTSGSEQWTMPVAGSSHSHESHSSRSQ